MNRRINSPLVAGLMIVALLVYSSFKPSLTELPIAEGEGIEIAQIGGLDLTGDQRRADALVNALNMTEVLGTLAPIALSPFFALTCLSGVSLASESGLGGWLTDSGIMPAGIADNFMVSTSSPLHNETVFLGLLVLTVLTSLPKLTTVSKTFAQAVDQIEGYSGIIAALAVQILSRVAIDDPGAQEVAVVYSAGFFTASYTTIVSVGLMIFSAINIFVVNSVKFFFEVMVWISPIPTIDAMFEAANKAFTAFLITVYLFSPWVATLLNLLIFLISLSMFAWTYRRVVFMRCVLADPLFGWFAENLFRMRKMSANTTRLPRSISEEFSDPDVVLKAFAGKKMKGIKKKSRGLLVHSSGLTYFIRPRLIGKPKVVQLTGEGIYAEVRAGLLSNSVGFTNSLGDMTQKVLFTKRYNGALDGIHRGLNARGEQVDAQSTSSFSDFGKSFSDSVNSGNRSGLQSELS